MSKLNRVTQKVFGSQASPNQIAQFGSFAAGSPVLMSPGSPAAIQTLPNYLQGWFASVVNGAAPAIEDMNALQYLYAYQLAYGFQEGIPEYDSGTTYFTNSITKFGNVLYISLTDNNTGNPVTDAVNWKQFFADNILPGSSTLAGTYNGTVVVFGDATIGSSVVINGDFFVIGNLSSQNGFGLSVFGDGFIAGYTNFTPTLTATAQENLIFGGNVLMSLGGEFKVNPGQFPALNIGGDFNTGQFATFDGSGQSEASGLSITVNGMIGFATFIILNGGNSIGTADAGNGGSLLASIINFGTLEAKGGNSTFNGFNAGHGGTLNFDSGSMFAEIIFAVDMSGGTSTFNTGGDGGNVQITQSASFYDGIILNGGNGVQAGSGGTLTTGESGISAASCQLADGTGTTPSNNSTVFLAGTCTIRDITVSSRTGNKIKSKSVNAPVILKLGAFGDKDVLTNNANTDTGPLSGTEQAGLYMYSAAGDTWYVLTGTPA